jgi:hypothetical protein
MANSGGQPTNDTGDVIRPRRRRKREQRGEDATCVEHLGLDLPFAQIPNVVIRDQRMSPEARAVLIFIMSHSESWTIQLGPMRHMVCKTGKPISRWKMRRIIAEIMAAGYMARSSRQRHKPNGDFGSFRYVCGMPDRVTARINRGEV